MFSQPIGTPRLLWRAIFLSAMILLVMVSSPLPAVAMPLSVPSVLATGSLFSFSGDRPANLGVQDGRLAACSSSPNCVSSQSEDSSHFIQPFSYSGTPQEALHQIQAIVEELPRTTLIKATDNYLYVEFTSALMGFVDDVEFCVDSATQVVHVRSASRLGESDLGVNRKRVELIRDKFKAALS